MSFLNGPILPVQLPKSMQTMDAATAGGMAFLIGELEKRDPKLYEPLTSTTWPRDIVAKTGGGWVDFTSTHNISYATTGGNEDGIIGGQTNDIPIMQADIGKDVHKVFSWSNILKVPFVDQEKLRTIGRSLDDILDKGIRLNHDKALDMNAYLGFPGIGTYGLVNNPQVVAAMAPAGASGSTRWKDKTPQEILNDVNQIQNDTWAASEYDLTGMANHFLIPPEDYTWLVQTPLAVAATIGGISVMEYLLKNNIGRNQGRDLFIAPCRQCIGAGEGGTDRMAAYANDEERVRFHIPVPLERAMTQPVVTQLAYLTAYVTQFGEVEWVYLVHAKYYDGI